MPILNLLKANHVAIVKTAQSLQTYNGHVDSGGIGRRGVYPPLVQEVRLIGPYSR